MTLLEKEQIVTDKQLNELELQVIGMLGIHITKVQKDRQNYLLADFDSEHRILPKGSYRVMDAYIQPTEQEIKRMYLSKLR